MKILYFHQHFKTPSDGGSIRSYLLALEMVKKGHQVTMITAHNGQKITKNINGIETVYLHVSYDNTYKFWRRVTSFLQYSILACIESTKVDKIDYCYVMTTPLTTGLIGLFNKYFYKRPYFFEVGDLWPLVPVEMKFINARLLKKFTFWLEKLFYQNSIGNIGMSPPITKYITQVAPTVPAETIYNISDCEFFQPSISEPDSKEFVICYTGTFGLANDLSRIIQIASEIQHLPIRFILIGAGADKPKIEGQVTDLGLSNVEIRDFEDKNGVAKVLNQADAMFISFANYDSLFTGSPNKLYDALAAGKLIITNFEGWIGELITTEKCGFHFIHNQSQSLVENIQPFLDKALLLNEYQQNARRLAETRFDLKIQSKKLLDFLDQQTS
ncbi:glycosyltransferase family 4 protein [Reichenbachiella agarivorans]|uniref:Glycosyltransferase family 4 protein n=1 Tax=Reichenbachiella agarivorans TaxID=2979464 RepID=A0ABY6CST9_9BACT|nr:glycosyltransferase family 4 protein [Reichenbachiella agarivorans]UXP33575.1 glycosyltransferase family 4 protein [Reichenbachiella agarivorans]